MCNRAKQHVFEGAKTHTDSYDFTRIHKNIIITINNKITINNIYLAYTNSVQLHSPLLAMLV